MAAPVQAAHRRSATMQQAPPTQAPRPSAQSARWTRALLTSTHCTFGSTRTKSRQHVNVAQNDRSALVPAAFASVVTGSAMDQAHQRRVQNALGGSPRTSGIIPTRRVLYRRQLATAAVGPCWWAPQSGSSHMSPTRTRGSAARASCRRRRRRAQARDRTADRREWKTAARRAAADPARTDSDRAPAQRLADYRVTRESRSSAIVAQSERAPLARAAVSEQPPRRGACPHPTTPAVLHGRPTAEVTASVTRVAGRRPSPQRQGRHARSPDRRRRTTRCCCRRDRRRRSTG